MFDSIAHSLGVMALLLWAHSEISRFLSDNPRLRQVSLGLLFGLGSVLAMHEPVQLGNGLLADARNVFVGLSGPFGGPIAVVVTVVIAAAYRLSLAGIGAWPSLVGFLAVGSASVFFTASLKRPAHSLKTRDLALLAALSCTWLVGLLFLPSEAALLFLSQAAVPTVLVTIGGDDRYGIAAKRLPERLVIFPDRSVADQLRHGGYMREPYLY